MCPGNEDDPLRIAGPSGVRSVAPTAGATEAEATEAAAPVDGPEGLGGLDAVAADLADGAISPIDARDRIVDLVLAAQLPADLPAAEVAAIREEVAASLFDDPVFAALLAVPDGS